MVFAICAQLLYLWALLYIARQMAVEVSDGASEQVLLVVVICVEARAARIANILAPLFDLWEIARHFASSSKQVDLEHERVFFGAFTQHVR